MKKWIAFMLVFVLAFVFAGCTGGRDDTDPNAPQSVEITAPKTEINVNEEVQLSAKVKPDAASQDVVWSSKNQAVATVDATGKVKGIAPGEVEIYASSRTSTKVQNKVLIKVNQVFDAPESVEITGRTAEVQVSSFITLTATVLPVTASQEVVWSSSDETIATVDAVGKVTGVKEGNATISVSVLADSTLTASYDVIVVPFNPGQATEDPTSVVIQGESSVIEGRVIYLSASVLPSGVSQNVIWTSLNESLATVANDGTVTGIKEGTVYIQAASAKDTTVLAVHKVVVKIKPTEAPIPDLGGYQIKIMAAPHVPHEHDPFLDGYVSLDKQAKQDAWLEVEDLFNCDLAVVTYPEEAPWGGARIAWLNEKAALGQAETDIFVSTTDWLKVLADGKSIYDTTEFYDMYGENSMNAGLKGASSYKGGLYALPTASVGSINVDKGLFYNVALVEQLGLESPAKLFNEGRWTYSGFKQYVLDANAVLSEGQSVLSGKPAAFYMGMVNAAGVKLADTITLTMNFNHPDALTAAQTLRELYETVGWGTNAWDAAVTTFNEGNSIFQAGEYWFVRTDNRWPGTLWDPAGNSKFGYVPYPYPDRLSKEETRTVGAGGACYMMAAGRQYASGVTAEYVYRAFVMMMTKTADNMQLDPEFDEETIMRRAAESKLDDQESITALVFFKRNKVLFDPLYGLLDVSTQIGASVDKIVRDGADYRETMDAISPLYEARMKELYS